MIGSRQTYSYTPQTFVFVASYASYAYTNRDYSNMAHDINGDTNSRGDTHRITYKSESRVNLAYLFFFLKIIAVDTILLT
jgi:hypothetical protein